MIEQLAEYTKRIAKIEGPARSGKTEILLRRCVKLIKDGVTPESILVVVSSEFARRRFYERLDHAAEDSLKALVSRVVVARALEVCVAILNTPQTQEATGRIPRLLTNAEYNYLLEDLKTLGQSNRRLRNMLLFFSAQWSASKDESKWLIPGEETAVMSHLRHMLTLHGAMLRDEAPYICARFLTSAEGKASCRQYDYVFCDDYQNLSHAEQACMCLCAKTQLLVCGNPNETTRVNTEYPSSEGFTKFDILRKNVDVFTLTTTYGSQQALAFGEALCACEGMEPRLVSHAVKDNGTGILSIKWKTPEEEIRSVARYLESLYQRKPLLRHNRVALVVPHKRWGRLVEKALNQRGLLSSVAGSISGIGGDPRVAGEHDALTAYVKLNLIAHPHDMVAWRAWCGFDHALTNSDIWDSLQKYAAENKLSLYETLELAATTDTFSRARIAPVKAAWAAGQELISTYAAYRGYSLLKAVGMRDLGEFYEIEHSLSGEEDARTLYQLVYDSVMNPRYPDDPTRTHITNYENLCGLDYDYIIVLGLVDGMMPDRDAFEITIDQNKRRLILTQDRQRFYAGVTKATKRLILSTFSRAGIEIAERAKMQICRVTSENGERVALLQRSAFFQESGAACPSTVGGEDVMSELLLN
jgi:DNA helicase-2/ATP-dependent DNA helicase PcrA